MGRDMGRYGAMLSSLLGYEVRLEALPRNACRQTCHCQSEASSVRKKPKLRTRSKGTHLTGVPMYIAARRLARARVARCKLFDGKIVLGHQSAKRGMTFSPTISMERMIWSCVVWPIWNMKIIWSMPVA